MDEPKMEKAGDLLGLFLSGKQFEEGSKWIAFFNFWKRLLGERLASHSRIRDVRNGALIVEADHPGWIQMLQMKQSEILREIQKRFPDISVTSIHIQLSERKFWNEDSDPVKQDRTHDVSQGEESRTQEFSEAIPENEDLPADNKKSPALESIKDGSFRELLKRLEDSIRKRERSAGDSGKDALT